MTSQRMRNTPMPIIIGLWAGLKDTIVKKWNVWREERGKIYFCEESILSGETSK